MEIQSIDKLKVSGFFVRTRNELEQNPKLGKIPDLWSKFFSELVPRFSEDSNVYGVYTNYESDDSGEFDLYVGSDRLNNYENTKEVEIKNGKYLIFQKEGEMPKAVIELWEDIWSYFKKDDCAYTREYKTDFEKYLGSSKVTIYIGIK